MKVRSNASGGIGIGILALIVVVAWQANSCWGETPLASHTVASARVILSQSLLALGNPPDGDEDTPKKKKRKRPEREPENSDLRKLTDSEINRIRFMELRGMRMRTKQPDRVTVKIPREVAEDFLVQMEGHPDFHGKKARRAFHKSTPAQKLHYMAYYKGAMFADRVQIRTDPEIFVAFRKHVMPYVLRGCASSSCHASTNPDERIHLRLYKDPKKSASTMYANFLMLDETEVGLARMIDRGQPENSLLLSYMLPTTEVKPELRHPGGITPKPVFQSRGAQHYKRILTWISSLKHPAEPYGVSLKAGIPPEGSTSTQPSPEEETGRSYESVSAADDQADSSMSSEAGTSH